MKFAFVTPRYGAEIPSGPEHGCRLLAEQLALRHDVDVLTTSTRDPKSLRGESADAADKVRGVLVRRFPVTQPHDGVAFADFTQRLQREPHGRVDELEWSRRLGPWSPGL